MSPRLPSSSDLTLAVVIPAYEAEAFVREALDSVWGQTRRPDECVVVDDGSLDRTAERIEAWSAEHELTVRLIRQDNQGESAARSAAVTAASCQLVGLLDADDVLLPHALATLVAGFEAWPDLVACFGNAERRLGDAVGRDYLSGKPVWGLPYERARFTAPGGDEVELRQISSGLFESLLSGSYIANCAAIVRRSAAIEAGLWSDEFPTAGDRDFWLRLSRVGPFAFSNQVVARVRYHRASLTATRRDADQANDKVRVLRKMERLSASLTLNSDERAAVRAARERAIEQALYWASLGGPAAYRRMVSRLSVEEPAIPWANPRHLGRALLSPLMRAMRRAPEPPDPG